MAKRIITLVLAVFMILPLAACSDNGTTDTVTNEVSNTESTDNLNTTDEEIDGKAKVIEGFTGIDYDGYNFRIADRGEGDWKTFDVYAEELTGEAINDAVYERNSLLQEKLNITITEIPIMGGGGYNVVTNAAKTSVLAQSDEYDVITDSVSQLATLVAPGYILDFRQISSIIPENKWWDQQIYNDLSIANKSYFMTGDISVMANYGTWCYLFNKQIHDDFGFENMYDLVNTGKWTIDKMMEMAAVATVDLDGDSKWTSADQYGFLTEGFNSYGTWACFGEKLVKKDENNLPYYDYNTDSAITKLIKSIESQYFDGSNIGTGIKASNIVREEQFSNGKALFYFAGMRNITLFRDSDTEFGILPAPKYDENQTQYWTTYSNSNCTAYSIPITVPNSETVGGILEQMAALSLYTLTPAYYDVTLIGKSTRDQESEGMLDIILDSRNFDLGMVYSWGNVLQAIMNMNDPGTVASRIASTQKAADKAVERFRDEMMARE